MSETMAGIEHTKEQYSTEIIFYFTNWKYNQSQSYGKFFRNGNNIYATLSIRRTATGSTASKDWFIADEKIPEKYRPADSISFSFNDSEGGSHLGQIRTNGDLAIYIPQNLTIKESYLFAAYISPDGVIVES